MFEVANPVTRESRRAALSKIFENVLQRRHDALNIWRQNANDEKSEQLLNEQNRLHQQKIK